MLNLSTSKIRFDLPGYQISELLYESPKTLVYRGDRVLDGMSVILKTLRSDFPTIANVAKIRHEYEITKDLNLPGVVKIYGLEIYDNKPILILEDFGGKALNTVFQINNINIFFEIAIQLAKILGELHKLQIIHKDIKPQNIVINPETKQLKIIDFSIASRLSKESPTVSNPNLLEGTLAYISPEQTGRMNRSVDYRTDFYSLGVTFYEMLTGQLPFQATDAMELVHCHIAKRPLPPHEINPEISPTISALVMKLLAKTAEDRYQSAYGIQADLETAYNQLLYTGSIQNFTIGQHDRSGQFEIPQKLYGRENDVRTLMDAFDRISEGTSEMMLVAGYSGIGKSALVNEIHKPIVRQKGYFISGKFDQLKRNIPYASLIQAFRELMRQLLTESSQKIQVWKEKLLAALGKNGQVIIDVIPELELIIGKQSPVLHLGATEAQNRFNLTFKNFIRVFTQKEHPLVIFLDDLQWADSATLGLIELLMTDPDGQYLLTICAYRDNEVSPTHPFILTNEKIRKNGGIVNTITLRPLAFSDIDRLVADTLNCPLERSQPLTQLLIEKTVGNPFFLTQLLKYLYVENLLTFNFNSNEWQWDLELLQRIGVTDNVVELMIGKIQKLSAPTQKILKLAACIGNKFNLKILAIVNESSVLDTASQLWEALQSNLIVPLSEAYKIPQVVDINDELELEIDYKFLHDRVQQAAYALIPEDDKKQVHLKVGQLLLQKTSAAEREDEIFDIANHLNLGYELISRSEDRYELAQFNLTAARKAKAATAYEAALKYLTVGLELLGSDSWQYRYELTLALHLEALEVEYLSTNFERAEKIAEVVLQQATELLDRVKVYELKIQFYIAENQMLKAIDTALPVLELLGFPLSQNPDAMTLVRSLPALEDLENIPEMTDPYQLAALQILIIITGPSYQAKPEILPLIIFKMVNLGLEYGHSALAAYAYGMYGLLNCGPLLDIETGYHSGQLSLQLLEQFNAKEFKCKVPMLFNSFIRHWKEPFQQTIPAFVETISSGLEIGDLVYAAYCCMWSCGYLLLTGETLNLVEQKQKQYADLLLKLKQEHGFYPAKTWRQLSLNLQGLAFDKYCLLGESFTEADMQHLQEINNRMLLFFVYLAKLILAYIFKDYAAAVANADIASEYENAATASMLTIAYNFYDSLARLAVYPQIEVEKQRRYLERVESNQQKMIEWARHAPDNFMNKYELVEAEKARVLGNILEAIEHYDRGIELGKESGFIQEVGIAAERAAEFYLSLKKDKIAQIYLVDSHYNYEHWGATTKVRDLESEYPHLFSRKNVETLTVSHSNTSSANSRELDLTSVMKASQSLSGEIVLDNLLKNLMKITLENAGAETGFLLLEKSGKMAIEAKGKIDEEDVNVMRSLPLKNEAGEPLLPLSIVNYVTRTKADIVLGNSSFEGMFTTDSYILKNKPKSVLCFPILNRGQLIGLLYLENNLSADAFTSERLEVLKILSAQAAISIENALLYQNLEQKVEERTAQLAEANREIQTLNARLKAENIRMSAELEVTQKLQQMILPKESELEAIEQLDMAGFMESATEVGGDYYDVLSHNGRVKIGIGDVTGHGLESGVLMIMVQTAVRTLLENNQTDPIEFLNALNRTIYHNVQRMNSDKNLTLSLLDYTDGVLHLSGQHEEIILVRNGSIEQIDTLNLGFPVGLVSDISDFVAQKSVRLYSGDTVVLYTDGITEAENIEGVQYGLERLCEVVKQNCLLTAKEIRQAVIEDLRSHIGSQKVYDDITLLVFKQK